MSTGPQHLNYGISDISSTAPQFEAAASESALAGAGESIIGIETGEHPVDIDEASSLGEILTGTMQIFTGSIYTGGDSIQVFSGNDVTNNSPTFTLVSNPTVTVDGDLFSPSISIIGFAGALTENKLSGRSLRLKPNTKYILKVTNTALTAVTLLLIRLRLTEII